MRRSSLIALLLAMAVAFAGCGENDPGEINLEEEDGTPTTAAAAPTTTAAPVQTTVGGTTVAPTNLTLRITEVRLVNSEESDNGMRILLPAGVASAQVTLTGVPNPNRVINVCQARELDRRLTGASCRTPANGEAVTVTLGSSATGVEIVQVGVAGAGAEGNSALLEEIRVSYSAGSRELNVRLPQVASGGDGGRPTFALTPPSTNGAYRAQLGWTVIPVFGGTPSSGQLELLKGGTTTGQAQTGGNDVRLEGTVPPPNTDAAIRLQNVGGSALVAPKLSVLLP